MGIHKKTNVMSLGQALWKKGVKARKRRQKKIFHGFMQLSPSCCFKSKLWVGGKWNKHFEVENSKSTDSNLIFLLRKSSTSDLDALTILDHACKIIKHPFCTQITSENLVSRQTSLSLLPYLLTNKGFYIYCLENRL